MHQPLFLFNVSKIKNNLFQDSVIFLISSVPVLTCKLVLSSWFEFVLKEAVMEAFITKNL